MADQVKSYSRVLRALLEFPWAIHPPALELMIEIVERRIEGREPSAEDKATAIAAAQRPPAPAAQPGSIAVLPVYGPISHRLYLMNNLSAQGVSAEGLHRQFTAAVNDSNVAAIVFDIDSPGGSVFGIQELADAILQARGRKPVVAVANSMAASAAYWIGAVADELVVTPSGMVGSVGVLAAHDDYSGAMEQAGVRRTFVHAGRYKVEGNPYEPLGDEARAELQRSVDRYYDAFVKGISAGRGVSPKVVRDTFGEGRLVMAGEALERRMVDRVETFEATIARLQRQASKPGARAEDEAPAVVAGDSLAAARARLELAGAK